MKQVAILLDEALKVHQSGDFDKASRLYEEILKKDSKNADAIHLLGACSLEKGNHDTALKLTDKAIKLHSDFPNAYYTLGRIHLACGRFDQAKKAFSTALKQSPEFSAPHHGLAQLCQAAADLKEAAQHYRNYLKLEAGNAEAWADFASLLQSIDGNPEEIEQAFRQSLQLQPDNLATLNNFGIFFINLSRYHDAIQLLNKVIELDPNYFFAINNLGLAYQNLGHFSEAETYFRRAEAAQPGFADALYNLSKLYHITRRFDDAIAILKRLCAEHVDNRAYKIAMVIIYMDANNFKEAENVCLEIVNNNPDNNDYDALQNLAVIYRNNQDLDKAEEYAKRSISVDPENPAPYNTLGWILHDNNRHYEAEDAFKEGLKRDPGNLQLWSNILIHRTYSLELSHQALYDAHNEFGSLPPPTDKDRIAPLKTKRRPYRKLRIAYLSPDFMKHVVRNFIQPILKNHDRDRVEVFCYAAVRQPDEITDILKGIADQWRDIYSMSDFEVSNLVREDEIDILIDLCGHSSANRIGVFRYKPAPVQVAYLGYITTTGLKEIDYRITDHIMNPEDTKEITSEALYRLPRCYKTYEPALNEPDVCPTVSNGTHLIFGSLHRISKLTDATIKLWSRVLNELCGSKLLLARHELSFEKNRNFIYQKFAEHGIGKERLILDKTTGYKTHMEIYRKIDISLDPIPVVGGATTAEGLWMGVPTLTLQGEAFRERISSSILAAVGLEDWIATSEDELIMKAYTFAHNYNLRLNLRNNLRNMFLNSELGDAKGLATALEDAYLDMWHKHLTYDKTAKPDLV